MHQILWAIVAIWGLSGAIVTVLFVIDERSFRRQSSGAEPQPVAAPSKTPAPVNAPARQHALV